MKKERKSKSLQNGPGAATVLWTSRPSWRSFYYQWLATAILAAAAFISTTFTGFRLPWWLWLAGFFFFFTDAAASWFASKYLLTDREVVAELGIFLHNKMSVAYKDVKFVSSTQNVLDRVLRVGSVKVASSATDRIEIVMRGISNPDAIADLVKAMKEDGVDSVVNNPSWAKIINASAGSVQEPEDLRESSEEKAQERTKSTCEGKVGNVILSVSVPLLTCFFTDSRKSENCSLSLFFELAASDLQIINFAASGSRGISWQRLGQGSLLCATRAGLCCLDDEQEQSSGPKEGSSAEASSKEIRRELLSVEISPVEWQDVLSDFLKGRSVSRPLGQEVFAQSTSFQRSKGGKTTSVTSLLLSFKSQVHAYLDSQSCLKLLQALNAVSNTFNTLFDVQLDGKLPL